MTSDRERQWRRGAVWLLSGVRLSLVVPLLAAVQQADDALAAAWLLLAVASDVGDGWLARRWQVASDAGALVDAVADAAVLLPLLWTLADHGRFHHAPLLLAGACLAHFLLADDAQRYDPIGRHLGTVLWGTAIGTLTLGTSIVGPAAVVVGLVATAALVVRMCRRVSGVRLG